MLLPYYLVLAFMAFLCVLGCIWRVRYEIRTARQLRRVNSERDRKVVKMKTPAMAVVYDSWRQLSDQGERARASQSELFTHRLDRRRAERQDWATEFERCAGHTWDGPWIPVEHIQGKTLYANKEHWEALDEKGRIKLIQPQMGMYVKDAERKRMARDAAQNWRAKQEKTKPSPDERTEQLAAIVTDFEKRLADKEVWVATLRDKIAAMVDGPPEGWHRMADQAYHYGYQCSHYNCPLAGLEGLFVDAARKRQESAGGFVNMPSGMTVLVPQEPIIHR